LRGVAPRERSDCAGSGERSRPHPTSLAVRSLPRREPPPSLRSGDYSRRELLGDGGPSSSVSTIDRGTGNLPRHQSLRSRRAKSPEVTEGGGARRGSEALARDQASGRGRIPRRSRSARSRSVSLLPRSARETTHTACYWAMVGHQVLSRQSIAAQGIFRGVRAYARGARSLLK